MNKLSILGCALLSAAAGAATPAGPATVTFVDVAKMSDVPHHVRDRENMEYLFREHISELAARLPAGQALKVDFLDIDLAGDEFPRVAVRDIRIMTGQADWPRLHLRFSLEQDGRVVASGERRLSDPHYMMGINRYGRDLYRHEKQMLDDWFAKDILSPR